ncbi:O-antigen ligase family protein [Thalassotalea litorea]|uniref:O-antigen ligase family protein n=1 Tax=Thalassotalea litorea TaxID=2020715 RepID=UPI0037365A90
MKMILKSSHGLQFYLLLVLIFWLPIPLGSNRPWAWALMEVLSFMLLLWCLATSDWQRLKSRLRPYRWFLFLLALFCAWQLFQGLPLPSYFVEFINPEAVHLHSLIAPGGLENQSSVWLPISLDPYQSQVMTIKSLSYLSIACLVFWHIDSIAKLRYLLFVLISAGVFQASYGVMTLLESNGYAWFYDISLKGNASGTFIYRNHFANFLLLSASMTTGWLLSHIFAHSKRSQKSALMRFLQSYSSGKLILRLSLAMMVIALVLSHSRMGNAAFFVSLTLTLGLCIWVHRNKPGTERKPMILLFISVLIIDSLILGSWFGLEKVKHRIENTSLAAETRDNVAFDSLTLMGEFPLTGTGAGSFYSVYPRVAQQEVKGFYDHAHNDYVQFVVEYGIIFTLIIGALVVLSFLHAFWAMKHRKRSLIRGTSVGCQMAIIAMLLHISVDFNLQSPSNSVYFIIILCLAWLCRFDFNQMPLKDKFSRP